MEETDSSLPTRNRNDRDGRRSEQETLDAKTTLVPASPTPHTLTIRTVAQKALSSTSGSSVQQADNSGLNCCT